MNRFALVSRNIFFYGVGKVFETAAALVWIGLIARYLGRDGFGDFLLVWAVVTMAVIIPEIGLNNVLIREASENRERAPELLRATIRIRRLLSVISIFIVIGIVFASAKDPDIRLSACIGAFWILGRLAMTTNTAIFFAYERIQYETLVTISYSAMVLVFLFAGIRFDWGLMGVLGAFAGAACAGGVLSSIMRRWRFCAAGEADRELSRYVLKESLPVGGSRALRLTGNKIDTLILSWLRTSGEVATYSGVYNLILRIINVPFLISRPLFPLISQLAADPAERDRLRMVTQKSVKLMLLLAMPLCMGLTVTADKVVYLVFGPEFEASIIVMRVLSWVLMFMFPCALASFVAIAVNRQMYLLKTLGFCIGLNVALDFLLIPYMGYYGPCVATLTAEVLFAFFLWRLLRETFPSIRLLQGSLNIALSAGAMGAILHLVNSLNLLFLILLGPVIYVPSLFLFRAFTRDEIEFFKELFLRRRQAATDGQAGG
jgi:O-antigen/teichoic acid export membrane protein